MNKYLVFSGDYYYPAGGWTDYKMDFLDIEKAKEYAISLTNDWWHIIDIKEERMVVNENNF